MQKKAVKNTDSFSRGIWKADNYCWRLFTLKNNNINMMDHMSGLSVQGMVTEKCQFFLHLDDACPLAAIKSLKKQLVASVA